MKNIIKPLFLICLVISLYSDLKAQSAIVSYFPSSSTLLGDASRIGYHYNNWTTYYMRYNDTSYFCVLYNPAIWIPTPSSDKIPMPQDFVIWDFKEYNSSPGYIGSYQGVGMYGWANSYNLFYPANYFRVFKLPAVDLLKRTAYIRVPNAEDEFMTKAFSVGKRVVTGSSSSQSYILEYYVDGSGMFAPYQYAPLEFNSTERKETADDVITIDHYVIFATSDTRKEHAPVNLRISDTTNVLSNGDIDYQWQFLLPSNENVYGELRLLFLDDHEFILAYTIYDSKRNKYYLCFHKIILADFLAGFNSIVSHEIQLEKDCSNLVDIVFEPDVSTVIALLNGSNRSETYHIDAYLTTSSYVTKLYYPNGLLWSIDTVGTHSQYTSDMYMAIEDNNIFFQDISNGVDIDSSCLEMIKKVYTLKEPPLINYYKDPLERYSGSKQLSILNIQYYLFGGMRTCGIPQPEE